MRFPILRLQTQHKYIKLLKKFLNELVAPPRNLPLDDVFDEKTLQAVVAFKVQWASRVYHAPNLVYDGTVTAGTWAMVGRALDNSILLKSLREFSKDYELRSLLLGMDDINRVYKGYYSAEMEACDAKIASIFGGENAIAAANGFEPDSLAIIRATLDRQFRYFRGDTSNNGKIDIGHLSVEAMHLYGSTDGTRFSVDATVFTDLYIPDGFRGSEKSPKEFKRKPGPNQASLDFYYPKLANYRDVTLLVSHIKNFKLVKEGIRWHIGQIGGKGGTGQNYIHAHLDLFKGDVGITGPRNRLSFARAFCPQ